MRSEAVAWRLLVCSSARIQSGSLFTIAGVRDLTAGCFVAWSGRTRILQQQGKHAEALEALREALRITHALMIARRVLKAMETPLLVK